MESKYHHCASPNKSVDIGVLNNKERRSDFPCHLLWQILAQKLNLSLIKALDLTTNIQELQETEEYIKWHHRGTLIKIRVRKMLLDNLFSLVNCKKTYNKGDINKGDTTKEISTIKKDLNTYHYQLQFMAYLDPKFKK